ncbi:MAG: recombinase family protein, partial [Lachnospiraceae bacterium]|nr:recombinase family protein [Lachnospiraceae bacterium]
TMENQIALVRGYIEERPDMEFVRLYCDNGHTGTDFARPAFEQMMQDVKSGMIDCIVVKDLSRFGRSYRETGNYLERIFPFLDVRFVAVSDQFDTLNARQSADGYIVPLKNIMNEAYSKDISKKVGSGYAVKQRKGEFTGTWAAYGYQKCADDPHRIEPNQETAPVVQDIFRKRILGMSCTQIARELNRQGIPSPGRYHYQKGDAKSERYACAKWSPKVVGDILLNEVYLGHMVQGRKRQSFREGKKQQLLPQTEWTVVRNTHEPLIDENTFQNVQETAAYRKASYLERYGKRPDTPNILKGFVYCADCGRRMTRSKSVTGRGTKAVYSYVCRSHTLDPLSCPLKNMPESKLMEILWDILAGQFVLTDSLSGQAAVFQNSQRLTKDMVQAVLSRIEIGVGGQVFVELQYQDEYRKLAEFVEQTGRLMA